MKYSQITKGLIRKIRAVAKKNDLDAGEKRALRKAAEILECVAITGKGDYLRPSYDWAKDIVEMLAPELVR
jgi:hypothetical protein